MKANRSLIGITLVAAALSIGACSKSNKDKKDSDSKNVKVYSDKYQFEFNGCNTGLQEFRSDSHSDLAKQLCDALQNEELNKRCAQSLRKSFFDKKCPGLVWKPVYPAPSQTSRPTQPTQGWNPSNPIPSQPNRDHAKEREVQLALRYLLVDSFDVTVGLNADLAQLANTLSANMRSCGFSSIGPRCMDFHAYNGSHQGTLFDPNGESIFITDMRFDGIDANILFAFKVKDENGISAEEVKVYVKNQIRQNNQNNQSIEEYLESASVQLISTIKISEDFAATAKERVQSPESLKELYHMARLLNELNMKGGNPSGATSLALAKAIFENKALFSTDDPSDYPYYAYQLASLLGANKSQLAEIAEEMLKSNDKNLKQFAAIQILLLDSKKTELKPFVLEALKSGRWDNRKNAITALSKIELSVDEQILVIEMIGDSDNDVRNEAVRVVNLMSLKSDHFATLKKLSTNGNWAVRREAAKIVGKIAGDGTTIHLISKMSDSDGDVRNEIMRQLNSRAMNVSLVPSLETLMADSNWAVRRDAASLLGKIKELESTKVLIKSLADRDSDVRNEVVKILSQSDRRIDGRVLGDLSAQSENGNWAVRREVAILIGKIAGDEATKKLISMLNDTDKDVRNAVNNMLSARDMNINLVESLKSPLSNANWAVRQDAARYLGKIKGPSSLNALLGRLEIETDNDVKAEISRSIAAIRG